MIPVMTFFSNGFQSGVVILELSSLNASLEDASSVWTIEVDSDGDGMTFSLGDDAVIEFGDADGSLRTEAAVFTVAVDTDTDSDVGSGGSNGGDAANSGATLADSGVTSQWWFWVMLFGSVVVIVALLVMYKLNQKFDD